MGKKAMADKTNAEAVKCFLDSIINLIESYETIMPLDKFMLQNEARATYDRYYPKSKVGRKACDDETVLWIGDKAAPVSGARRFPKEKENGQG